MLKASCKRILSFTVMIKLQGDHEVMNKNGGLKLYEQHGNPG